MSDAIKAEAAIVGALAADRADLGVLQSDLAELCALLGLPGAPQPRSPHAVFQGCLAAIRSRQQGTPAARWREEGKPDPTPTDQERADLPLGNMTDDELANHAYIEIGGAREGVANAAKVRMRWLSRRLVEAEAALAPFAAAAALFPAQFYGDGVKLGADGITVGMLRAAAGVVQPRRWRHVKRGTTYTEEGRGKLQAELWRDMGANERFVDGEDMVVYRADEDGTLWVRPVAEFEDGRFEEIKP